MGQQNELILRHLPVAKRAAKKFYYLEDASEIAALKLVTLINTYGDLPEAYLYVAIRRELAKQRDASGRQSLVIDIEAKPDYESFDFLDMFRTDEDKVVLSYLRGAKNKDLAAERNLSRQKVSRIVKNFYDRTRKLFI
jgi:DNA-directed RNA polymerase specialized sigma subunit